MCRSLFDRWVLAEIEVIVAAERQQCPAIADDVHAIARSRLHDRAAEVLFGALGQFLARELVKGEHRGRTMTAARVGRNRKLRHNDLRSGTVAAAWP